MFYTLNDCYKLGGRVEWWKTNTTTPGTSLVADINPKTLNSDPQNFTTIGNVTYFSASDGSNGYALFKTDGTPNGTVMMPSVQFTVTERLRQKRRIVGLYAMRGD